MSDATPTILTAAPATAEVRAEAGARMLFADRRHRRQLHWRLGALVTLRVALLSLLLMLAAALLDLPLHSELAAVETCFNRYGEADPRELISDCVRGNVAEMVQMGLLVRNTVLMLVVAIAITAILAMLVRGNYRKLLDDQLYYDEQLIDALPLPLSLRSPEGTFLHVNKAFEARYGLSRHELLDQPVAAFFPTEDAAGEHIQERALNTDEPVEQEFAIWTPRGRSYVLVRLRALRRVDGSLIGLVGVETDITALRQKEAELIESNARLKQLPVKLLQAQEQERRRIARDLHDGVGQILTALKLQLRGLAQRSSIPGAALASSIDLAEEALGHTRDLSISLHPHLLDDLGMERALNWLVDRFIRPSVPMADIVCRLSPPRGEPNVELVAFRVVQEALTNVVRHAQATRVGVILEAARGQLTIEVLDDGIGFGGAGQVDLLRTTSLGLTSMYERVCECGGEMHIDSTRGVGTSLRVRLPWKASEA
jgi:two-component system, NarL family, sensor histidine kinase UhpB